MKEIGVEVPCIVAEVDKLFISKISLEDPIYQAKIVPLDANDKLKYSSFKMIAFTDADVGKEVIIVVNPMDFTHYELKRWEKKHWNCLIF
ncbi:MAG: hypothetical protein PHU61_04215 [Candidatus Absconditabacteria bacterium]|nr:hypothetical protein [Candidatus Absconditabacteria bacterium]MDD3868701.1 hypothetical protein [Candidatus Absconditabacteria bacterium]MDD4714391.1 hypothetical protein [Candidatus Absconditabacteria bacterium]